MFEHYLAALLSLGEDRQLAHAALPNAPVQPAPADHPAAGANGSSEWDPCPCRQWGVARGDRHGCVALVKELFPKVDRELDTWEAEYSWLYR